ncbi:hypothetical protein [Bacillus salacetis]|nr:hypothetical protein [Bacillus salacetis]
MKDKCKDTEKKQNFQEEFGMEFGDFNAAKHFEIPETNKKQDKKRGC